MSITIPVAEDGTLARECPNPDCSPGYFKVTPGTGISEEQEIAYCPYCRREAAPNDFATKEQIRYAEDVLLREARKGGDRMMRDALGTGASGKRKISGGSFSLEVSYKPSTLPHVRRPFEDEVRRDVVCPHCALDQTVFGLATWCADCGEDIFLSHVKAELAITRLMLEDVGRREDRLGKRVAAKDLENCLEDVVSIFEAAVKAIVHRVLIARGEDEDQIEEKFRKLGNAFQNIDRTQKALRLMFDCDPLAALIAEKLDSRFAKRHPIAHNLGVVDRKHLKQARRAEQKGREIRITSEEVPEMLVDVFEAVSRIHERLIL